MITRYGNPPPRHAGGMGRTGKIFAALTLTWAAASPAAGQNVIPPTFGVFGDDFESGLLESWNIAPGSDLALVRRAAHGGALGLEVVVSQGESHLIQGGARALARADEGYLSFWFHPSNVVFNDPGTGFLPGRAIQIAGIKSSDFKNMVAMRIYDAGGGSYQGFLEWRGLSQTQYDYAAGSFPVANRWQRITIGYRANEWVAGWIDGTRVRSVTGIDHLSPQGSVVEIGKTLPNSLISPVGTLRFDDVLFHLPRFDDLWVDASSGSDANDGLTSGSAFATISRASDLAGAGTTVHVLPGVYRGAVVPAQGGLAGEPAIYAAENGPGTVIVRGSVPSSTLSWTRLGSNTIGLPPSVDPRGIWWTDLSAWGLSRPPRFVVRMGTGGRVAERLPMAREPDWQVRTDYKPSELWWIAGGGSTLAGCDPTAVPDCDLPSRSTLKLTDVADDPEPAGIEPGNLTTHGDLTGATLVARDLGRGHFHYRRTIVDHSVVNGRVTVDSPCTRSSPTDPGLGWGSQYFVEDHPALLDSPGEWWYNRASGILYLWPPSNGSPANQSLEISRHEDAFDLTDRSHVTLKDLDLELFNGTLVENRGFLGHVSVSDRVVGCRLRWANRGVELFQQVEAGSFAGSRIEGFRIVGNEIGPIDFQAISVSHIWDGGSAAESWVRPGIFDTVILNNTMHDVGFRAEAGADSSAGLAIRHADRLTIEGNTLSNFAHEGILINESVVQSSATWGFSPDEIKIGEILVKDNVVERVCQLKGDCGGIRIWGVRPSKHVYRDVLLIGNQFRDIVGWSWAAEQRGITSSGHIPGAGGNGIYIDGTSGIHAYRNVVYNNGHAGFFLIRSWRDGKMILYDNVVVENVFGIILGSVESDTHVNFDTRARNNAIVNNEAYGIQLADLDNDFTNTIIDSNLYQGNGWGSREARPGAMKLVNRSSQSPWPTLADIRANSPFEDSGQEGDPSFADFIPSDHDPFDGSRPDFHLREGSIAVDAGTTGLPASLTALLTLFGIADPRVGPAWDQGAFEGPVTAPGIFTDGFESGNLSAWSGVVP